MKEEKEERASGAALLFTTSQTVTEDSLGLIIKGFIVVHVFSVSAALQQLHTVRKRQRTKKGKTAFFELALI